MRTDESHHRQVLVRVADVAFVAGLSLALLVAFTVIHALSAASMLR
jgi:hypothetical protein